MKKKYLTRNINSLRDFYWLAIPAIIMIFLCLIMFLVSDYLSFRSDVESLIKEQNNRIRSRFVESILHTKYATENIGKQILINYHQKRKKSDHNFIENLLLGYRHSDNKLISWSTFSWADKDYNLVVSSNQGIMKDPIDVSYRDYALMARQHPKKVHIGRPEMSVVSQSWAIPVGYGVTDRSGEYLGLVISGIVIDGLKKRIEDMIRGENISFVIIDKFGKVITKSDKFDLVKNYKFFKKIRNNPDKYSLLDGDIFYKKINNYPYSVITIYNDNGFGGNKSLRISLYLVIISITSLLVALLFSAIYQNFILPIAYLSHAIERLNKGKKLGRLPRFKIYEVDRIVKFLKEIDKNKK